MKKLLVLLLAVLLFALPLSTSVSAAKTPTFIVSNAKGTVGDKVQITISVKENTGVVSMKPLIKYDSKALKVVECEAGKFSGVAFSPNQSNPFVINWLDPLKPNNKSNGTLAIITFEILNTAPNGKSEIVLTYDSADVFDSDFNEVAFEIENGCVEINNPNPPQNTPSDDSQDVSSDVMIDTTASDILQQAQNSSNQSASNTDATNSTNNDNNNSNVITWVVVAVIIAFVCAFALIILKSNKNK